MHIQSNSFFSLFFFASVTSEILFIDCFVWKKEVQFELMSFFSVRTFWMLAKGQTFVLNLTAPVFCVGSVLKTQKTSCSRPRQGQKWHLTCYRNIWTTFYYLNNDDIYIGERYCRVHSAKFQVPAQLMTLELPIVFRRYVTSAATGVVSANRASVFITRSFFIWPCAYFTVETASRDGTQLDYEENGRYRFAHQSNESH